MKRYVKEMARDIIKKIEKLDIPMVSADEYTAMIARYCKMCELYQIDTIDTVKAIIELYESAMEKERRGCN